MNGFHGFLFAACVSSLSLSCSGGGGGVRGPGAVGTGALTILSPRPNSRTVNATNLTIEIADTGLDRVAARIGGASFEGVANGSSFFIFEVPLSPGTNRIDFDATDEMGTALDDAVLIDSTADPRGPVPPLSVVLDASPRRLDNAPFDVVLSIDAQVQDTIAEVLVDQDGDSVFDQTAGFSSELTVTYAGLGVFKPRVTVRTSGNLLFTSDADIGPSVTVLPVPAPDPALNIPSVGSDLTDLLLGPSCDTLFALSAGDRIVRTFAVADGALLRTIALPGVSQPQGIAVDEDDNLYVADTGNNRILKLLSSSGYQPDTSLSPDGSFGSLGANPGEFDMPMDVTVAANAEGERTIFVADAGNDRIQRFSASGAFELDLSSEPAAPALLNPSGLVAIRGGGLIVCDTGHGGIHVLSSDGAWIRDLAASGTAPGAFRTPTHLSLGPRGLLVADTGNARLQRLRLDGALLRVIDIPARAGVDADSPTEGRVFVAPPTGDTILVLPLPADPPGFGPVDAVEGFVAALAAADFDDALSRVFPSHRPGVAANFQDPAIAAGVAAEAATMGSFEPVHIRPSRALVSGERATPAGSTYNDFVLERDPLSGRWMLTAF